MSLHTHSVSGVDPDPSQLETSGGVDAILARAYQRSVYTPAGEQAEAVRTALGSRLAATCLGLKDTRTLGSWTHGGPIKGVDAEHRLQVLYRVVTAIAEAFTPAVAAAFLRGTNPILDGRAPMLVIADTDPAQTEALVLSAVQALLSA